MNQLQPTRKQSPPPCQPKCLLAFLSGPQSGSQEPSRPGHPWAVSETQRSSLIFPCTAWHLCQRLFCCIPLPSSPPGRALQAENARVGRGRPAPVSIHHRQGSRGRERPVTSSHTGSRTQGSQILLNSRPELSSRGFPGCEISAHLLSLCPEVR